MCPPPKVYVLKLHHNLNGDEKLYRLEKGCILRFALGPSLMGFEGVRLFCNHPKDKDTQFDRFNYREIPWKKGGDGKKGKPDPIDLLADVEMLSAGSFKFFFTVNHGTTQDQANGSGYFLVDPTLCLGPNKEKISLDAITCQTVITKLLGPFEEWMPRLLLSVETGYNMIHFTPIQELGVSNSAYSISDQLKFSPVYSSGSELKKKYSFDDVENLVDHLNRKHGVLSVQDLVLNHTCKKSPWVLQHPECTYNLDNTPHLRPAYVVDRIFANFSLEVSKGQWVKDGIPISVKSESHLNAIDYVLRHKVFPQYRLHEFYCVEVDTILREFRKALESLESDAAICDCKDDKLAIIQDPQYRRLKSTVDLGLADKLYNLDRPGVFSRADRIEKCVEALRRDLVQLNRNKEQTIIDHIHHAISNFVANARWRFVDTAGPCIAKVTPNEPLMWGYFILPESHKGSAEREERESYVEGRRVMAVHGWLMGAGQHVDFCEPGNHTYLRRELIAWCDIVKLNYGRQPSDCPHLWERMEEYTRISAQIFHGFRIDNCHSTPFHVAEHMLSIARKIRPDLYVMAELFTGSEELDNMYMNHLGINSIIRESLTAWNAQEQRRLIHRFGGKPVGVFIQPKVQPLLPSIAHAIFYDQTHDNQSAIEKRSPYDCWPLAALVAFANCATGSNRGFDEMVPHNINVVTEKRLYSPWLNQYKPDWPFLHENAGITIGKRSLNKLHSLLSKQGFSQIHVDLLASDTISVTRHNPVTHESVILIARTSFSQPHNPDDPGNHLRSITLQGCIENILVEGCLRQMSNSSYLADPDYLNGLPNFYLHLRENFSVHESEMIHLQRLDHQTTEISLKNFTPGSVLAFRYCLSNEAKTSVQEVCCGLRQFDYKVKSYINHKLLDKAKDTFDIRSIISKMSWADLNHCLYRIDGEERDGVYNVPESGPLTYCGLSGVTSLLAKIRPSNNLGHPLCNNLREGSWLADYFVNRLLPHKGTEPLGKWFLSMFSHLKTLPGFLVPCYFDAIVTGTHRVLLESTTSLMSDFIRNGSMFVKVLSMTSVQLVGYSCGARLPSLSPKLKPSPRTEFNNETKKTEEACLSISAGFPHYGVGHMCNWGRDTFIALRGLLLITGRHQDAKHIILAYGGTLRHGLIPNLLNEGKGARYNCRDAIWFWLQSIQDYCKMVENGMDILKDPVSRMYPDDDDKPQPAGKWDQPLYDVVQEALSRHAVGIKFWERYAGYKIDELMLDEGFNNRIGIDWTTGFVQGGNEWNCGTWMDKMGSSSKAGHRGKPATPRDGSAVELVGLCASTVKWLGRIHKKGLYPFEGVDICGNGKSSVIKFEDWHKLIKHNFEKNFYISETQNGPNSDLIQRRGIYKDSVNASQPWANYQLRCNYPIAMVVAPDLFTPENAWIALENMGDVLLGPLGIKTLDPKDLAYRGDYDIDNDSDDLFVAHGWNYHQGPEWIWPIGYFLRAKLYFAKMLHKTRPSLLEKTKHHTRAILSKHYEELLANPWQGLPELTNSDGQFCKGSCPTHAPSAGCILEVLYDLAQLEQGN